MIIDAHLHLFAPGSAAERVFGRPGNPATLLQQMDRAGIDAAVVLGLPGLQTPEEVLGLCGAAPGRLFPLLGVHPAAPKDIERVRYARELGFYGLKLHPRLSRVAVTDPRWDEVLEQAAMAKVPVLFDAVPQCADYPLAAMNYLAFDVMVRRHPTVTFILAHACAPDVLGAFTLAKANKNVYLDMSFLAMYYGGSSLEKDIAFVSDNLDRYVIYGSDFPQYPVDEYLAAYRRIVAGCQGIDLRKVLAENAVQVFGLPLKA